MKRVVFDFDRNETVILPPKKLKDYYWTEEDSEITEKFIKEREGSLYQILEMELKNNNASDSTAESLLETKNKTNNNISSGVSNDSTTKYNSASEFLDDEVLTPFDNIEIKKGDKINNDHYSDIKVEEFVIKIAEKAIHKAAVEIEKEDKSNTIEKNISNEKSPDNFSIDFSQEGLIELQDKLEITFDNVLNENLTFKQLKMSFLEDNNNSLIRKINKEKEMSVKKPKETNTIEKKQNSLVNQRVAQFNTMFYKPAEPEKIDKKGVIDKLKSLFKRDLDENKRSLEIKRKAVQQTNCYKIKENPFVKNDQKF